MSAERQERCAPLPTPPLGTVIATRRLYERGNPRRRIELRVGRPVCVQGLWACPYQILGIRNSRVQPAFGEDSLQALELVFVALRGALDASGRRFSFAPEDTREDPGVMIARHVPYSLGRSFEERLNRILEREIEQHAVNLQRRVQRKDGRADRTRLVQQTPANMAFQRLGARGARSAR